MEEKNIYLLLSLAVIFVGLVWLLIVLVISTKMEPDPNCEKCKGTGTACDPFDHLGENEHYICNCWKNKNK
jgi:hypothetical protein